MSISDTDKIIGPIGDPRLEGYTQRNRNGRTQVFYTGRDARDFPRYKRDQDAGERNPTMHLKPDTIELDPPEKHFYALLIDGVWHWVNGCAECNGRPRDWMTYIECDKHNVCRTCGCGRDELDEPPWAGKHGWQCKPCADREHEEEKAEALAAMEGEEYDEHDYMFENQPKCPYCNYVLQYDGEEIGAAIDSEQEEECPRCDHVFHVVGEMSVTFSTRRKECGQ